MIFNEFIFRLQASYKDDSFSFWAAPDISSTSWVMVDWCKGEALMRGRPIPPNYSLLGVQMFSRDLKYQSEIVKVDVSVLPTIKLADVYNILVHSLDVAKDANYKS